MGYRWSVVRTLYGHGTWNVTRPAEAAARYARENKNGFNKSHSWSVRW